MHWNSTRVAAGLAAIGPQRALLLLELKQLMDEYHHWQRPLRYYDILAGDWLEHFAHLVYAAWREVLEEGPGAAESPIPVTSDLNAYAVLRWKDDRLHAHLRWTVLQLLQGRGPAGWRFETDTVAIASGGREALAQRVLRAMGAKRPDLLLVFPYFRSSHREAVAALWRWRHWASWDNLQYPVRVNAGVDATWRLGRALDAGSAADFSGLLRALLPLHVPVALLEGFAGYRDCVLALPVSRPRAAYSANALHGHLTFKLLMAEWAEAGTRLLYHQHGGGYGIDREHAVESYETRAADQFFSLGWSCGDIKVKPLPLAKVSSPARDPTRYRLLSCVDFPKHVYRLHFHPMPGTIQTMHRETCDFLATLPDCRDVMIRPYPHDYGWGFAANLQRAAPLASMDDRRVSAMARYAQSSLVIHNYLGTGWLETLSLNIPTVCFFDADTYAFRANAQPWIEGLERVGILHRSGAAAARFVATLGEDPLGWWQRGEVQQARINFVTRYANYTSDWAPKWEAEFRRWIE